MGSHFAALPTELTHFLLPACWTSPLGSGWKLKDVQNMQAIRLRAWAILRLCRPPLDTLLMAMDIIGHPNKGCLPNKGGRTVPHMVIEAWSMYRKAQGFKEEVVLWCKHQYRLQDQIGEGRGKSTRSRLLLHHRAVQLREIQALLLACKEGTLTSHLYSDNLTGV